MRILALPESSGAATADGCEHSTIPSVMRRSIAMRIETQVVFHLVIMA